MSSPEVKPRPCGGMQQFLSTTFNCCHGNQGGEDQTYLKLQSSLRCAGEGAGPARVPALALRPGRFFLFLSFLSINFALPRLRLSCLSFLVEQEKALMAVLGLPSFPFD